MDVHIKVVLISSNLSNSFIFRPVLIKKNCIEIHILPKFCTSGHSSPTLLSLIKLKYDRFGMAGVSTKTDKWGEFHFGFENFLFLDGDVPHATFYSVYISQEIRSA